jgi:AraC-like DNA-binding protein
MEVIDASNPQPVSTLDRLMADIDMICDGPRILRRSINTPEVVGNLTTFFLRPGLSVVLSDMLFGDAQSTLYEGNDTVKLHFRLSGEAEIRFSNQGEKSVDCSRVQLITMPSGISKWQDWDKGSSDHSVTIIADVNKIDDISGAPLSCFRGLQRKGRNVSSVDFAMKSALMNPGLRDTALALWEARNAPGNQYLLMEAKTLEILYHVSQMTLDERDPVPERKVSSLDRHGIEQARSIIEGNFSQFEFSIPKIASMVGMCQTKLCRGFKEHYGVSIFEYGQRLRMHHAHKLLTETDMSVIQVALEVGYEHQSNFATAFKRYFGCSPRAFRQ